MRQSTMNAILVPLASLRLTCAAMVSLFAAVLVTCSLTQSSKGWIILPLVILSLNLVAALVVNRKIRRSTGLIVFHLALLVICVLAGAGILTRMHARIELVEGQSFDPEHAQIVEQGPWHVWKLPSDSFVQGPIEVDYASGLLRQDTRSRVMMNEAKRTREIVLSDAVPLKVNGYRLSTTSNKGYALVLAWRDRAGREIAGAVHMPSFPALEWKQERHWRTPGGEDALFALKPPRRPSGNEAWTLRSGDAGAKVTVAVAGREFPLGVGEWVPMRDGAMRLEGVRLWMGYRVDRAPQLFWMLLTALIGIAGLSGYFHRRLWSRARDYDEVQPHGIVVRV